MKQKNKVMKMIRTWKVGISAALLMICCLIMLPVDSKADGGKTVKGDGAIYMTYPNVGMFGSSVCNITIEKYRKDGWKATKYSVTCKDASLAKCGDAGAGYMEITPKKTGKSTIVEKVTLKKSGETKTYSYKHPFYVVKPQTPFKSFTIAGKNYSTKFTKSDAVTVKTSASKVKVVCQLKNGWKLDQYFCMVNKWNKTNKKNTYMTNYSSNLVKKNAVTIDMSTAGSKGYEILVCATETKTGQQEAFTVRIKK